MAYRLGDYVVYGELRNKFNYFTHGLIALRGEEAGRETILHLNLTGDCCDDLKGKSFRFFPEDPDAPGPAFDRKRHRGFQTRQIGPTGEITAEGWARALPCSAEEYVQRATLGEPPPTQWKRRLYIEWHSQNGRVVIEMAGVVVEECIRETGEPDPDGDWIPLPNNAPRPNTGEAPPRGLSVTAMHWDGAEITSESLPEDSDPWATDDGSLNALQISLDAEARAIDRAIQDDPTDDDMMRETILMDDCIENRDTQPLSIVLGDLGALPAPDGLGDAEIRSRLKTVLMRLALFGVSLDVCAHMNERDCYRVLRDDIIPESGVYPELAGTGWVTHFSTSDYCPQCDAEYEKEFREQYGEFDENDPPF